MRFNSIFGFVDDHLPLVITFTVMTLLSLIIVYPLIIARIDFGGSDECKVDSRPAVPVLLSVVQDPETLTVTAEVRDESDNEQWFALERTLITRNNQVVAVGTNIQVPNSDNLPVSRDVGRTVVIIDRGIVANEKLTPGQEYVYTVRALNCFGPSQRSNDIKILSLFPL